LQSRLKVSQVDPERWNSRSHFSSDGTPSPRRLYPAQEKIKWQRMARNI
jgi:hypothetical protein